MAKVLGIEQLKRRLQRLPGSVFDEVGRAVQQGAEEIVDMQKRLAPVRTGALRDSIQYSLDGKAPKYAAFQPKKGRRWARSELAGQLGLAATISAGNTNVRYAHLVEFGAAPHIAGGKFEGAEHPGATAQPFFYPSYRALKRRVKGRITRAVGKGVKRSAGK